MVKCLWKTRIYTVHSLYKITPAIAQLVEHETVEL